MKTFINFITIISFLIDPNFWVFEIKDTTVGLQEQKLPGDWLKVYPNPAKDYVIFSIPANNNEDMEIIVSNIFGNKVEKSFIYKTVGNESNGNLKYIWDSRESEDGVYFYNIGINNRW